MDLDLRVVPRPALRAITLPEARPFTCLVQQPELRVIPDVSADIEGKHDRLGVVAAGRCSHLK